MGIYRWLTWNDLHHPRAFVLHFSRNKKKGSKQRQLDFCHPSQSANTLNDKYDTNASQREKHSFIRQKQLVWLMFPCYDWHHRTMVTTIATSLRVKTTWKPLWERVDYWPSHISDILAEWSSCMDFSLLWWYDGTTRRLGLVQMRWMKTHKKSALMQEDQVACTSIRVFIKWKDRRHLSSALIYQGCR